MKKIAGFDTEKYLCAQEKAIRDRLLRCQKLYLEFGGKLIFDGHAARTLPGYNPYAKMQLLQRLKADLEILFCISAKTLQAGKIHGDSNLNHEEFTLKLISELRGSGLPVSTVVINRYEGESNATKFASRLNQLGINTCFRKEIPGYPNNTGFIISDQGYGADPYIKTTKPIVLVTAPGPNDGKLSTCLGQLYHENRRGILADYAKFETFPVWDLPLKHPINIAYEAATADLGDFNLIDPFHLEAYQKTTVNYNRDVEAFPIIKKMLEKLIPAKSLSAGYQSPTDMGVNRISEGIINDGIVQEAAKQEVIFYYYRYRSEAKRGFFCQKALDRSVALLKELSLDPNDRQVAVAARLALAEAKKQPNKGDRGIYCAAAVELPDKQIVTGKNSLLLHAEAAVVLNALKVMAGIPDEALLLSPDLIKAVRNLKQNLLRDGSESLTLSETLIALSIASLNNPQAKQSVDCLDQLRGCSMHTTHFPASGDESAFRKLWIWVTTDGMIPISSCF